MSKDKQIPLMERLLSLPRVKAQSFYDMSKEQALEVIIVEGGRLNKDNPWSTSEMIYDRLRRELGYWKALGANNSVIS